MTPDLYEAAKRWEAQESVRAKTIHALKNNSIEDVESPERLKKRVERLMENLGREQLRMSAPVSATIREQVFNERTIGKRDFLNANFTEMAAAVARYVGRIIIKASPNIELGYGTGFMVSPNLMMTNNHVFASKEAAKFSLAEFDYQLDRENKPLNSILFEFDPDTFFITDPALDFSLVAVRDTARDGKTKISDYGWTRLIGEEGKILKGENVNIIQHPNGDYKKMVLRDNELIDLFDLYAHYITDTEQGSSGAPVFNDQWEVIALHHSGVPKVVDGNIMTTDDRIWQDGMDDKLIDWVANEGIRISRVIKSIKSLSNLNSLQKTLVNQLLEMEPAHPFEVADRAEERSAKNGSGVSVISLAGSTGDGTLNFSFMVPVQVQIRAGVPVLAGPVGTATSTPADTPPPQPPPTDSSAVDVKMLPEFQDALTKFSENKAAKYYDEQADLQARKNYYRELDLQLGPQEFYSALSQLLTKTHKTKPPYKPATQVYPWIDLHEENGKRFIKSIYSGKQAAPEEFIEADIRRDLEIKRLKESFQLNKNPLIEAAAFVDSLEASMPYNCEHVVPQSWFNKKEPMRGDIHHLFACESGCNSFRGNIPYFDFPDFEETIMSDCGKRETAKFEPGNGKGAVARATLYFLLRYPGHINAVTNEYTPDRIEILLSWHKNSPPDIYEFHRNQAIFEKQGNRNPLIDFPAWAEKIDFRRGLG